MSTEETGLANATTKTPGVIATAAEFRASMAKWQLAYNVLTPFTNVTGIAPSFGIIASVVKINPDSIAGEVYSGTAPDGKGGMPFLKGTRGEPNEELAIAKVGLRKLAECGGISTSTVRTDPRTIPNYWEFKAIATYRGLDGSNITREATFEWDLRNGSDRMKGWTANQITENRKNGLRSCEARAINAAIRECGCGIKQKYTRAELEKPFLVVRVAFQPDMADPAIKEMVTRQALGGVGAMYPQAAREQPAPQDDVVDGEVVQGTSPRSVGAGATAAVSQSKTPAAPAAQDLPPCEGAVKIASVAVKTFLYKNGAKKGTEGKRFVIVDSNGVEHSTFSEGHAADAERFKKSGDWVEFSEEREGNFTNLLEIIKAGTEPPLPGLDGL